MASEKCQFGIVVRRLDRRGVLEERRVPLARLSSLEPVPVVEAFAGRPAVERPAALSSWSGVLCHFPKAAVL
jgi:hypothetical protein